MPFGAQRRFADLLTIGAPLPEGTEATPARAGGVPGERVVPRGAQPGAALLYLHGGGYVIGSARSSRGLVAHLAAAAGLTAFVPDYRLAPEHPHPAALEDALAAYEGLLESGIPAGRIALAGDSAGGGLALALALTLRDRDLPQPAVVALLCPWLDLGPDITGTRPAAPREPLLTPAGMSRWASAYVNGVGPADPAISPLLGDLTGLPPLLLDYAAEDLLGSDGERLVEAATSAGAEIEHQRHEDLWHDFHTLAGSFDPADEALERLGREIAARLDPVGKRPRVGIIGAGMSGLCMAARLQEAGYDDFTVYEKAETLGGTWRENRYPGLTCDVPSRFYSYSFALNPGWSHAYAPGPEIHAYFERVAADLGLGRYIRYGSEVNEARWEDGRWQLRTADGHEDTVDVLVSATGVLHHPRLPEIPGLETFEGPAFHSARWDESIELGDKRIAVIGTGSTGTQIVAALAGKVRGLTLFQRTAQWVLPVGNRTYARLGLRMFERIPALQRLVYRYNRFVLELLLGEAVVHDGWQRRLINFLCRRGLRQVKDPELRRKLTPDYQPMCKRLVMSGDFYDAMQKPGVELVTERIERVEPQGIVTDDGVLHEVDLIVLATGFDAHAYMRPIELTGEDGVTLEQAWEGGPRAYQTVALPGFPNFFTLMGPHSPVGNQSLISVAESQVGYVMRWIDMLAGEQIASVSPTREATERFNEELRSAAPSTIWATGCNSWYLGEDGLPELWPWTPGRHREMLREPALEDFSVERR